MLFNIAAILKTLKFKSLKYSADQSDESGFQHGEKYSTLTKNLKDYSVIRNLFEILFSKSSYNSYEIMIMTNKSIHVL